jgi:hypothetical protein
VERDALEALARVVEGLGIRWVLIGALAANRYRITTRLTQDVDLLLADAARVSKRWSGSSAPPAGAFAARHRAARSSGSGTLRSAQPT